MGKGTSSPVRGSGGAGNLSSAASALLSVSKRIWRRNGHITVCPTSRGKWTVGASVYTKAADRGWKRGQKLERFTRTSLHGRRDIYWAVQDAIDFLEEHGSGR